MLSSNFRGPLHKQWSMWWWYSHWLFISNSCMCCGTEQRDKSGWRSLFPSHLLLGSFLQASWGNYSSKQQERNVPRVVSVVLLPGCSSCREGQWLCHFRLAATGIQAAFRLQRLWVLHCVLPCVWCVCSPSLLRNVAQCVCLYGTLCGADLGNYFHYHTFLLISVHNRSNV